MNKIYVDSLPQNYFGDLNLRVLKMIERGENVCVSVIYGHSNKTIYSFLTKLLTTNKTFYAIHVYDPFLIKTGVVPFVKKTIGKNKGTSNLVIIRFFEKILDKRKILDELKSLQDQNRGKVTFLAISNHDMVLNPLEYAANTTIFFSDCIYIAPFNLSQTTEMVKTLKFYNWKIKKGYYKKIHHLSGGIGRIIKYICMEISDSKISINDTEKFFCNSQISFELDYLSRVFIKSPPGKLFTLGLVDKKGEIKSKLLRKYFENYKSVAIAKTFPTLSANESKILSTLIEYNDRPVSLDKIAEIIKMTDESFSMWAIYKTLSRLRSKTLKNYKIRSLKNIGYVLERKQLSA